MSKTWAKRPTRSLGTMHIIVRRRTYMAFSDDDLMPFDGVARIIQAAQKHSEGKYIFRFPLEVVDEHGKLKYKNPPFKTNLTSGYEFLLDKLSGKLVLPPVSMYLAEQYGNKREDL